MATLKDVARIAQVSPITVSRVINTPEKVKPATRERVRRVMSSLQYIPNVAAKNLVTKRSGIIDVFVPESIDLSDPFVMQFIAGISNVLSRRMYSFLILRDRTREHFCDGYIVTGLLKNEILEFQEYAARRSRPVVLFGHTELQEVDCIDVDNVTGAKELVDRLIRAGHRRIAMINVAENKDYTADRYAGYEKALRAAGIPVDPGLVARAENTAAAGGAAAQRLLADTGCTAIFCATDTMAVGVCRAAAEKGLSIPGDLSLVLPHRIMTAIQEMIQALDRVTPGIASDETLLYGVEVKFYSNKVVTDRQFRTSLPGLYAMGDGASITRGLMQASANGLCVAECIADEREEGCVSADQAALYWN